MTEDYDSDAESTVPNELVIRKSENTEAWDKNYDDELFINDTQDNGDFQEQDHPQAQSDEHEQDQDQEHERIDIPKAFADIISKFKIIEEEMKKAFENHGNEVEECQEQLKSHKRALEQEENECIAKRKRIEAQFQTVQFQ